MAAWAAVAIGIGVGACGGRVDGISDRSASAEPNGAVGRRPPGGSSGVPGRQPPAPATAESAAAEIAEAYCKTFSSCCVGAKLPPIDVARCRQLVSTQVGEKLERSKAVIASTDLLQCIDAIKTRTAACGKEDYAWWSFDDVALFNPKSVLEACGPLVGVARTVNGPRCDAKTTCGGGLTCAIDLCVEGPHLGEPCPGAADSPCLDGAVCISGVCTRGEREAKSACSIDDECRLGLLCFKGECAPASAHPEQYVERHSPYRVGADTCKAYTDL